MRNSFESFLSHPSLDILLTSALSLFMLSRRPRSIPFTLPSSSSPPSFPGLVSCLRPIKRLILQLSDEASLLHRFSYKNKNQHKASKWWNKLISVDRIMFRLDEELNSLLQGFGRLVLSLTPTVSKCPADGDIESIVRIQKSRRVLRENK